MTGVVLVWAIAAGTIAAVLLRPKQWPEYVWSCLGALLLVVLRLLPLSRAGAAVAKGTDVYLFLSGMMLLSELARREGVFDWLAGVAVRAARQSRARLFSLVYLVGVAVTVLLSNDATAVVLTPAVYAAARRARTKPLPYLLICAFIANAASFVLPISNPANLVVYGKTLPPLLPWLRSFLLASVCSILATYFALRWVCRGDLAGKIEDSRQMVPLSPAGKWAAWGIVFTGAVLVSASGFGLELGLPTLVSGVAVVLATTRLRARSLVQVTSGVAWGVLLFVAGLFVIVEALDRAGALRHLSQALVVFSKMSPIPGSLAGSFGTAMLSNIMNNLPAGLLAAGALQAARVSAHVRDAVLVGVDLGPNLSVTGSLATVLWLIALRREGERISAWEFLRAGIIVMPPALLLATIAVAILDT